MKRYWLIPTILVAAMQIFSVGICAQTSTKTSSKTPAAQGVSKTSDGVPDFSGVWEGHMPASTRKWAGYAFTGEIPPMTAWGKAQYEATKPSWGPRAVVDSTDLVNPTTGNEIGCFPTGGREFMSILSRWKSCRFPAEWYSCSNSIISFGKFTRLDRMNTRRIWTQPGWAIRLGGGRTIPW